MDAKKLIGRQGESAAAAYLKKKKYRIVAMNYGYRFGEIDRSRRIGISSSSSRSKAGRAQALRRRGNS